MAKTLDQVTNELLRLSVSSRATLAARLLESLEEDESDEGLEEYWRSETKRRLHELRSGKIKSVPASEVFRRAEQKLG